MAEAIGTVNLVNTENVSILTGKNNVEAVIHKKRPALGEIGNKVGRFQPPQSKNALLKKTATSHHATNTVAAKNGKTLVDRRLKPTVSASSLFSVSNVPDAAVKSEAYSSATLEEVEDVDKKDSSNPLLVSSYVGEIYKYLVDLELKYPIKENFLSNQHEVTPKMRATLIDWLIDVQEDFKLLQETLFFTVSIIDRYLQEVPIDKQYLQLVGVGALFLACKFEEVYSLDVSEMVFVTDQAYSKKDVLTMEKKILNVLKFELGKPLSLHFLRRFSKVANVVPAHHNFSKYFLEWALLDYDLCHMRPSHLAAGALFIAIHIHSNGTIPSKKIWTKSLAHYSGVRLSEAQSVAVKMAAAVLKQQQSKYKAIGRKYASSKMMKVSLRPELSSEAFKKLANGTLP